MDDKKDNPQEKQADGMPEQPPGRAMMHPYVFTFLLMAFGAWCFWDGWLADNPDMEGYVVTMNRVASLILIPWAVWDFIKVGRKMKDNGRKPDN
ncbi:MAG TPA: hypothetical protein DHV36_02825 [Desulfobacteraceae bacterium]|nr:hypothetical protein [Desulfobacteraceae bacterium]